MNTDLGSLLHLDEDHGGDLLGSEGLRLSLVLHAELGQSSLVDNLAIYELHKSKKTNQTHQERPVLHICLHSRVVELATNQTLGVEDGVGWVDGNLERR